MFGFKAEFADSDRYNSEKGVDYAKSPRTLKKTIQKMRTTYVKAPRSGTEGSKRECLHHKSEA
jgi:hypothetical protein